LFFRVIHFQLPSLVIDLGERSHSPRCCSEDVDRVAMLASRDSQVGSGVDWSADAGPIDALLARVTRHGAAVVKLQKDRRLGM
jgi:hypothetical protein